ncbi:hypothetical protein VTL71DRAFT_7570 [Oculimacula yallundae]|uniref:Uncharacterized protein n=1 Tax=Oculimacula yallundae TaxID=86028 RepID=A0ABR4BUH4_9HELO
MAHTGSSSTKGHNGSHKGSLSSRRETFTTSDKHKTSASSKQKQKSGAGEGSVERFVRDERDYRSFAVEEYDPHQEAAKQSHAEKLKDVVQKKY